MVFVFTGGLLVSGASASAKSGTPCKKAGFTEVSNVLKYTCVKSGNRLIWDKGTKIPQKISTNGTESLSLVSLSAGCINYKKSSDFAPYVVEWGVCHFENTDVQAYKFAKASDLDSFLKTLEGFTTASGKLSSRGLYAIRGLFMFAPSDMTKLKSLRAALGL